MHLLDFWVSKNDSSVLWGSLKLLIDPCSPNSIRKMKSVSNKRHLRVEIALALRLFFPDIFLKKTYWQKCCVEQNPAYKSYMSHTANYSRILFSATAILQHPERRQSGGLERVFPFFESQAVFYCLFLRSCLVFIPVPLPVQPKGSSESRASASLSARRQVNLCKKVQHLMTARSALATKPETINLLRHSSCCLLKWQLQFS